MQIFFDHQIFSIQDYGGISRYYTELIDGINRNSCNNQAYLPLMFSNNVYLRESSLVTRGFFSNQNLYKKEQIIYRTNQAYNIHQLHRKSFDVFHPTYYAPYFIPYLKGRPFVVTFLDMIHEKFSNQFPELADGGIITKQKQLLAIQANRIITISESTKRDVVDLLNVDPNKVDVIYLGNSLKCSPLIFSKDNSAQPYLLFVGRRERYKNFEGLLKSIHTLLKKYKLKLICAGGGPFSLFEQNYIQSFGMISYVEQHDINSDEKLRSLYESALAFVFPSLYEGFGIPILEAFASNCPCILSETSSLPEIAGSAAVYFDPLQEDSISTAIEQVITNNELRQRLISQGKEQLKNFSWEYTANKTLAVYEKCMNNG